MNNLILIRGVAGSGKSTLAHKIKSEYSGSRPVFVFEADDYFNKSGEYEFDATKLNQAHKECLHNTIDKLKDEKNLVIVSNTFTMIRELTPYVTLDDAPIVIEMSNQYDSIHDVPKETIEKMKQRFATKQQVIAKFPNIIYTYSNKIE